MNFSELAHLLHEIRQEQSRISERLAIIETSLAASAPTPTDIQAAASKVWGIPVHEITRTNDPVNRVPNDLADARAAITETIAILHPHLTHSQVIAFSGTTHLSTYHAHRRRVKNLLEIKDPVFCPKYQKLQEQFQL